MKDKVQTADAHRAADSRLNHVIKGKCGAARMYLELFQSRLKQENGKALDDEIMQLLLLPLDLLDQAAAWCHRRQFYGPRDMGDRHLRHARHSAYGALAATRTSSA